MVAKKIDKNILIKNEESKYQYENRREFEVIISEKIYYSFNWLGMNRKYRRFIQNIKIKSDKKDNQKINKIKIYISIIKLKIFKIWEIYCEIWNNKFNKKVVMPNGYFKYLKFDNINFEEGDENE